VAAFEATFFGKV